MHRDLADDDGGGVEATLPMVAAGCARECDDEVGLPIDLRQPTVDPLTQVFGNRAGRGALGSVSSSDGAVEEFEFRIDRVPGRLQVEAIEESEGESMATVLEFEVRRRDGFRGHQEISEVDDRLEARSTSRAVGLAFDAVAEHLPS